MTVFERQQNQMKLQLQQRLSSTSTIDTPYQDQAQIMQGSSQPQSLPREDIRLHKTIMMLDHCLGWPESGQISMSKEMLHSSFNCSNNYTLETNSLNLANSTGVPSEKFIMEKDGYNSVPTATPKTEMEIIEESLTKRKMDQFLQPKVHQIHLSSNNGKEMSTDSSKGNSRLSEVAQSDYIHFRARRGQATDRHSLAERVRREKKSQKMKFLQDLVPGCNMITGKTGMLDEIINYVQALQSQVKFLSMKLAAATTLNLNNVHNLLPEVLAENAPKYLQVTLPDACSDNIPLNQIRMSTITETILHSPTAHLRTTYIPAWSHDNFQDTASFTHIQPWDTLFQAIPGSEFHQRKHTILSQPTEGDSTINRRMHENFTML